MTTPLSFQQQCPPMKKARPILFSGPMIRAILDDRKTQTRRIIKPQPIQTPDGAWMYGKKYNNMCSAGTNPGNDVLFPYECPYGWPGDRLWIRETWAKQLNGNIIFRADFQDGELADYTAIGNWRPSIHMPREASRITLRINEVLVKRLHDIIEADAIAEGVETIGKNIYQQPIYKDYFGDSLRGEGWSTAQRSFLSLWEKINGHHSWDANPWVWAITFQKIE